MMGHRPATLRRTRRRQSGQAAVESALVLPLALFMVLGAIQLFMMHQARIMAEYAVFRATRAGSVNHGNCEAMNHAALAALLPTLRMPTTATELGNAFEAVRDNTYGTSARPFELTTGDISDETVVWIYRETPLVAEVPVDEDREFDAHFDNPRQLQITLVYWYPLRIPFADWVLFRMAASSMGVAAYLDQNPLMMTAQADWQAGSASSLSSDILNRMGQNVSARRYLFPLQTSYTMRMMTPPKKQYFDSNQHCFTS